MLPQVLHSALQSTAEVNLIQARYDPMEDALLMVVQVPTPLTRHFSSWVASAPRYLRLHSFVFERL